MQVKTQAVKLLSEVQGAVATVAEAAGLRLGFQKLVPARCEMQEGSRRKPSTSSFADRGFVCFPRTSESCTEPLCGQMPEPFRCTAVTAVNDVLSADTTFASSMCGHRHFLSFRCEMGKMPHK